MLKGKTKIQLFDAATGKETACWEKSNMVTNAVSRLFNGDPYGGLNGTCPVISMGNMFTPIATNALGGIMLWQDAIVEDVNAVMPPSVTANTLVGHAGGAYSGTNALRGSYNAAESGQIEGGYRNVWDFNTDRANGTINCVTLTSAGGGNTGFIPSSDGNGMFASPYHFSTSRVNIAMDSNTQVNGRMIPFTLPKVNSNPEQIVARLSDGTLFVRQKSTASNNTSVFYRVKMRDCADIGLVNDYAFPGGAAEIIDKSVYEIQYVLPYYLCCADSTYFYTSKTSGNYNLVVTKRLIETGTEVETVTLTIPSSAHQISLSYSANNDTDAMGLLQLFNGRFYLYVYGYLHIYETDGTYVETYPLHDLISFSNSDYALMYQLNGCLFLNANWELTNGVGPITKGSTGLCVTPDNTMTATKLCTDRGDYQSQLVTDFAPNYPFLLAQGYNNKGSILGVEVGRVETKVFRPYIATINNLSVPIVKTNAQTMKIIYDIYEE